MSVIDVVILVVSTLMLIGGVAGIIIGTEILPGNPQKRTSEIIIKARILQWGGVLLFLGGIFVASLIAK